MALYSDIEISNDIDTIVRQEHNEDDGLTSARGGLERIARVINRDKELYLPYCIAVSLLLHVGFFAVLPHLGKWAPARPFPSSGDEATRVRLVELPPQQQQEKPPESAAAVSDRDHTAERERLPRALPAPKSPLGQLDSMPNRIAALPPPVAPEDFDKPKEEKRKPEEKAENQSAVQKPLKKGPPNGRDHAPSRTRLAPQKNRNVDLRPTPGEIARGLASPGGPSDFFPEGDPDETVVDINTREERFFSYLLHLKRKIQSVWIYPSVAAKAGIGGNLTVEFLISREGQLLGVNLLDSSGHAILDESAISAIKSAAPFFPFPERLTAKRMRIRANFIYVTSSFLRNIM